MKIVNPGRFSETPIATKDCERKDVRVYVLDPDELKRYEIPVVESRSEQGRGQVAVETQVRKDGIAALTYLSDIYFPAVWKGEEVVNMIPPFKDDSPTGPIGVLVEGRRRDTDEWIPVHFGWMRKIGSGGDGRMLRMRVDDYSKVLDTIPASKRFSHSEGQTKIKNVLKYVVDELRSRGHEVFKLGDIDVEGSPYIKPVNPALDVAPGIAQKIADPLGVEGLKWDVKLLNDKTFEPHRDTLADVMNWLVSNIDGAYWYFGLQPYQGGGYQPRIYVGRYLKQRWNSKETGGNVTVRKNLAMEDLNPVNTVDVTGDTEQSVFGIDIPSVSKTYPVASATYKPLYQRAGGVANKKRYEVDKASITGAIAEAKNRLREELESGGESQIILNGTPLISPYDTITAKPVCDRYVQSGVSPVTYGINRVTHEFSTTGLYTTTVEVGLNVDESEIIVTADTMTTSTGTDETADDVLDKLKDDGDGEGLFT